MEFAELVLSRRTVHTYEAGAPVSVELVREALDLGRWAMNHKMTMPWHYTLIGPQGRAKLADLSVELKSAKGPLSETGIQAARANIMAPSHLIALGMKRQTDMVRDREDFAALAGSVHIAALFLWQNGVASKWSTGAYSMHARTYEILGLDTRQVRLEGVLMIGHAAITPLPPNREAIDKMLFEVP